MANDVPSKPMITVLLVDDHEMVLRALHKYLEKRGYNLLEARDGEEALLIAECYPATIQVLVTDLVMARMNGRELVRRLLPLRPEMQVIMMSGYPDEIMAQQGLSPLVPILPKPFKTEPGVRVLVQSQWPEGEPRGEIVLAHGLEGSGESGYMRSLSQAGLEAGFAMHRFHMRTCGGTAHLSPTLYHAGLTSDLLAVLRQFEREGRTPVYLAGFSLGGNVLLKLTGELGESAGSLIAGTCALSTPIDLSACARRLGRIDNRIYERRFVRRMCERLISTGRYTEADFRGTR